MRSHVGDVAPLDVKVDALMYASGALASATARFRNTRDATAPSRHACRAILPEPQEAG
ncbi:MAG: hypothetical protein VKQ33_07950 [Candidatus Sericytochromatia bacterium]|nr:hypothetical protein [Candidatus Sericytochromatia bacterium]